MFTYGVGALVDLPKLSVIVTGLEDWPTDPAYVKVVNEDRLLQAVRYKLPQVTKLLTPPIAAENGLPPDPFDKTTSIGVPVATFPRWMVCPRCRLLAPLSSNLFDLKADPIYMDRTAYKHTSCQKGRAPEVVPARFLAACETGHLDDFPWVPFVHQGESCDKPLLRLLEFGPSGEASDLQVRCDSCGKKRFLTDAFGQDNRDKLPRCTARRPHLRDYDPAGCENKIRPLTLGASNTWFPVLLSTVAIPAETDPLAQLMDAEWAKLQAVTSREVLSAFRSIGQLGTLSGYADDNIWAAIQARRARDTADTETVADPPDLKTPEWQVLTRFNPKLNTDDFQLRPVSPPVAFTSMIRQVVLVERLREVRALIGFTRIDSVGELTDPEMGVETDPAPLSRQATSWVPASEVRGEGIFLQFDEHKLAEWLKQEPVVQREAEFFEAHKRWRAARLIKEPEDGFPGMRYVFLHTFTHALMRELAIDCGYTFASIRERIYSRNADEPNGSMAGVLIYTSAPDSEGTLGGLVNRGEPDALERHIAQALDAARLCASDPLCAEHPPSQRGQTLHAAACHACLFAPETSCERGNKYLDRSTLVKTVERIDLSFLG
jgi:hypothetical protein